MRDALPHSAGSSIQALPGIVAECYTFRCYGSFVHEPGYEGPDSDPLLTRAINFIEPPEAEHDAVALLGAMLATLSLGFYGLYLRRVVLTPHDSALARGLRAGLPLVLFGLACWLACLYFHIQEETEIRVWIVGAAAVSVLAVGLIGLIRRGNVGAGVDFLIRAAMLVGLLSAFAYLGTIGLQFAVNEHVRSFLKRQDGAARHVRAWAHQDPYRSL